MSMLDKFIIIETNGMYKRETKKYRFVWLAVF